MTEGPNGLRSESITSPRRSTRSVVGNSENKEFLKKLNAFMKSNHTPIGRIPSLGYRECKLIHHIMIIMFSYPLFIF